MTTFYLKYRPQKINQLDLEDVRTQLTKILSSGHIPHAFLFTGSKGLGKTSAARILAKVINCQGRRLTKKRFEPCQKCSICTNIARGTSLDLVEIDAASNRGIDDIRALRENIKLAPNEAEKKVYVIDEVHMLTKEAFNALLKTLEEPPDHVLFILCTTQVYKLPETVISRCQHLKFKPAQVKEIKRSLQRIEKGEKLKLAKGVKEGIARHGKGSFRDATKLLERLVSLYGKKITLKQAEKFFGEEEGLLADLLEKLAKRNSSSALKWLNQSVKQGMDPRFLTETILETLRQLLLAKYQVKGFDEKEDYGLEIEEIKRLINLFDQAGRQLRGALLPQLPLEMAIAQWGEADDGEDKGEKNKKKNKKNTSGLEKILTGWPQFLKELKESNHSLEALLKAGRPVKLEKNQLTIEVFYPFHKGKLEDKVNLKIVQQKLQQVFDQSLKVDYLLAKKQKGR